MCMFCGHPGLIHDLGGPHTSFTFDPKAAGVGAEAQSGATAAADPSGSDAEVTFISGMTSGGLVAGTSFGSWAAAGAPNTPGYSSTFSWTTKWGPLTAGSPAGTVAYWFDTASNWTTAEKNAFLAGLALWSAESNIQFAAASSAASAGFVFTRGHDGGAWQDFPNESISTIGSSTEGAHGSGVLISVDTSVPGFGPLGVPLSVGQYGNYPWQTIVHEEGHLLGLGHAGPYNGNVNEATQQFSAFDSRLWSIMSYIDPWETSAKYYSSYTVTGTWWGISPDGYYYEPNTPMPLDILAAQRLYGVATTGPLASGGQVFGFHTNLTGVIAQFFDFTVNTHPVIAIWDGGLHNTLDLSGWSSASTVNLNPNTFSSANGEVNNIGIAAGTTIETAITGNGNDTLIASSVGCTLIAGAGNDVLTGGIGNDTFDGGTGADTISCGGGDNTVLFRTGSGADTVNGFVTGGSVDRIDLTGMPSVHTLADVLAIATQVGANTVINFGSGDTLTLNNVTPAGLTASDFVFSGGGGGGTNAAPIITSNGGGNTATISIFENLTAVTTVTATDPDAGTTLTYSISGGSDASQFRINPATGELSFISVPHFNAPADSDHNNSYVVQVSASDGSLVDNQTITVNVKYFDAIEYIASYPDLIAAFGDNLTAGTQHYVQYGINEGRSLNSFDAIEYIASNADLIAAFGNNPDAGAEHYVVYGFHEGRSLNSFDAIEYIASNPDLIAAFGNNPDAGAAYYVQYGIHEARPLNSFDAIEYIASYSDLIAAFGNNPDAGAAHYVQYGVHEGRSPNLFNAEQYLANYSDLQAAFGDDPDAAAAHYVVYGHNEERTDHVVAGSTLGIFVGNAGANTMTVGASDTMTGGAGADTFVFKAPLSAQATITDFAPGSDILQISASGFGHGLVAGAAVPLVIAADISSASHAGASGYFIFDNSGTNAGTLYWDANGGSGADAVALVHLNNVSSLTASDFHLI